MHTPGVDSGPLFEKYRRPCSRPSIRVLFIVSSNGVSRHACRHTSPSYELVIDNMHIIFFHLTRARTLLVYIIFHCADLFLAARPVPPSSPMKPSLSIQLALALPLANHAGALAPPRAAPPRILEAPSQPVTRREAALSLVATVAAASLVPGAALADSASAFWASGRTEARRTCSSPRATTSKPASQRGTFLEAETYIFRG